MGLPGENNQEGGPYPDAINRSDQFPNPNKFLLRNIFGTQNVGWSNESGASPFSFNFETPIIPATNPLLPWVPGPQMGWSPTNISFNFGGGFGENPISGSNGTNGTNGSGGTTMIVSYFTDSGVVTVDPCEELYFEFADGEVVDDGAGKVTVFRPGGGGGGGVDGIIPITVTGSNDVGLNYDDLDSFEINGLNELQLKLVTVTTPTDAGVVTNIDVDDFGRVTGFERQAVGVYRILSSAYQGNGFWSYILRQQLPTLGGAFPFFQDGSVQITAFNFLETANASGLAYGYVTSDATSPIVLNDYPDYVMRPVPNNLKVHVWKFDNRFFFSAPNPITGVCPS